MSGVLAKKYGDLLQRILDMKYLMIKLISILICFLSLTYVMGEWIYGAVAVNGTKYDGLTGMVQRNVRIDKCSEILLIYKI